MARRADGPARRGHVLVVANPKGGVGKSTLSVNLACALAASGARVAIVDNDEQGSAAAWAAGCRSRACTCRWRGRRRPRPGSRRSSGCAGGTSWC